MLAHKRCKILLDKTYVTNDIFNRSVYKIMIDTQLHVGQEQNVRVNLTSTKL